MAMTANPASGIAPGTAEGARLQQIHRWRHHPCQIARPDWSSTGDSDPEMAHATRQAMLDRLAGTPSLVIGTHFAGRTADHVVRDGDTFRLAE
jgi:hypothetical protein